MKKGRHRRFEEARALKRSHEVDLEDLFDEMSEDTQEGERKPEHDAWADLAEEWEQKSVTDDDTESEDDDSEDDESDVATEGDDD